MPSPTGKATSRRGLPDFGFAKFLFTAPFQNFLIQFFRLSRIVPAENNGIRVRTQDHYALGTVNRIPCIVPEFFVPKLAAQQAKRTQAKIPQTSRVLLTVFAFPDAGIGNCQNGIVGCANLYPFILKFHMDRSGKQEHRRQCQNDGARMTTPNRVHFLSEAIPLRTVPARSSRR